MPDRLDGEAGAYEIRLDEDVGAFVVTWRDDIDGEPYRDGMDRLLEHVERHDVSDILFDSREQGRQTQADREWTIEDWQPRAVDAGVERVAVVYPTDPVARQTVDMAARKKTVSDMDRLFTSDIEAARNWLRIL
jgi:hypothetical protein